MTLLISSLRHYGVLAIVAAVALAGAALQRWPQTYSAILARWVKPTFAP